MIPCTDFIPAYSSLFSFLHEKGGQDAVREFWAYLSDNFLGNLKGLVEEKGLGGCWEYWSRTLKEEAADFTMSLDEEKGEFRIDMHTCPSKGRLLSDPLAEVYPDYCGHCDLLYRRVLEPLGFEYSLDLSECGRARCSLVVGERSANS